MFLPNEIFHNCDPSVKLMASNWLYAINTTHGTKKRAYRLGFPNTEYSSPAISSDGENETVCVGSGYYLYAFTTKVIEYDHV